MDFRLQPNHSTVEAYLKEMKKQGKEVQSPGFELIDDAPDFYDRLGNTKMKKVILKANLLL